MAYVEILYQQVHLITNKVTFWLKIATVAKMWLYAFLRKLIQKHTNSANDIICQIFAEIVAKYFRQGVRFFRTLYIAQQFFGK
jgi:hypothetical protein